MNRLDVKRVQVSEEIDAAQSRSSNGLTVRQVMTAAPSCTAQTTCALELVRMFHLKEFRHLLVVDRAERLVGVISDRDVLRCFGPQEADQKSLLETVTAAQLMSTDLVTIGPDAPLATAVSIMLNQGISCLPVLCDGKLVGIVTNTDLQLTLENLLKSTPGLTPSCPLAIAV